MELYELEGVASIHPEGLSGVHAGDVPWPLGLTRCRAYMRTKSGDEFGIVHDCILDTTHIGVHVSEFGGIRWEQ